MPLAPLPRPDRNLPPPESASLRCGPSPSDISFPPLPSSSNRPPPDPILENGLLCSSAIGRKMKYMLLAYGNESDWTEEERVQCYHDSAMLAMDLHQDGKCIDAAPL